MATCAELGIALVAYSYGLPSRSSPLSNPPTALSVMDYLPVRSRAVQTSKKAITGVITAVSRMM